MVLDLAPRYAAFMNSITNSFYTLGSILAPIGVGFIVTSHVSDYLIKDPFSLDYAIHRIAFVLVLEPGAMEIMFYDI